MKINRNWRRSTQIFDRKTPSCLRQRVGIPRSSTPSFSLPSFVDHAQLTLSKGSEVSGDPNEDKDFPNWVGSISY